MPHILLLEDDPQVRGALLRALAEHGYATSAAGAGMPGLQAALRDRPDLVILDLGLPDVDGHQVLRMIRAVSRVPVIVATARDDEPEIVRALDGGADDYLVKPFSAGQLAARIRAVLR
ncbi:MAG: response regulator transcription factor, partial [Natronosporangium sp.]